MPGISKPEEICSWLFKFKSGAFSYLSEEVYPDPEQRRYAWINATLRAATLGNFDEMVSLIELFDSAGDRCEALLKSLEAKFSPSAEAVKKKHIAALMAFVRGSKSLQSAVKELRILFLECRKVGYVPDDETAIARYEAILLPAEVPLYRLYSLHSGQGESGIAKVVAVLEALARDQPEESASGHAFAGAAFGRSRTKPRRAGYDAKGASDSAGKGCERCGVGSCPYVSTGKAECCFAAGKKCNKCGKVGHFKSKCRSVSKAAAVIETEEEASAESTCFF